MKKNPIHKELDRIKKLLSLSTDGAVKYLNSENDRATAQLIELMNLAYAQGYNPIIKDDFTIYVKGKFKYHALTEEFKYVTSNKLWRYDYSWVIKKVSNLSLLGGKNAQQFQTKITPEQTKLGFEIFLARHQGKVRKADEDLTIFNEDLTATYHDSMMWEVKYTKQTDKEKTHWVDETQLSELIDKNIEQRTNS